MKPAKYSVCISFIVLMSASQGTSGEIYPEVSRIDAKAMYFYYKTNKVILVEAMDRKRGFLSSESCYDCKDGGC